MAGCSVCGGLLKPEEEGGICFTCRMERLEGKVQVPKTLPEAPPPASFPLKAVFLSALGLCCIFGTALLVPGLLRELRPTQPFRNGYTDTDAEADKCIANLWLAAASLQVGGSVADFYCPVSREKYIVEVNEDETVVRCPNPERHGLRELTASSLYPVPLAVN